MSLLLRKLCQPILDDYGLGHLHTTEIDCNKTLRLTTECGKTTVTVSGIKFTKPTPNIAEIKYAAELLKEYLDKNIEKVENYLNAKATFNKCPTFELPKNITITHKYTSNNQVYRIATHNLDNNIFFTLLLTKKLKYEITFKSEATLTKKEVINYKLDEELIKLLIDCIKKDSIKADLKQAAEKALDEFSVCTI